MAQGIAPSPSILPVQIQGVSAFGATGGATNIPPAIAVLPAGALLRGMITGRNAQGRLVLQTEQGDLVLHTTIFFKRGMELTLRLEKTQDEMLARILTVDGTSLAKYVEAASGKMPEQDAILQSTLLNQEKLAVVSTQAPLPPPATAAQTAARPSAASMTAIVLTPLLEGEALNSLPPQVAQMLQSAGAGTQLRVRITQLTLPDAAPPPATLSATTATASAAPLLPPPATAAPLAAGYTAGGTPIIPPTRPAMPVAPSLPPAPTIPAASPAVLLQAPSPPVAVSRPASEPHASITALPASPPMQVSVSAHAPAPTASPAAPASAPPLPVSVSSPPATATTISRPVETPAMPAAPPPAPPSSPSPPPAPQHTEVTTAPSVPRPAPLAPVITATVLESSVGGLTLQSPLGTLRLLSPVPLQPGTRISFEIEQAIPASATATTGGEPSRKLFSSLEELLALPLPAAFPAGAASPYHPRLIPKAGKELTAELLFLMSALKGGSLRKWLGEDTLRRLEDSKEELLKHISAEFSGMKRSIGEEGEPVRWNLYQLPLATATGMEPLRLYHREKNDKEKQEKQRGESGEHFILDVTFTRIGTLQLDGFVKKTPSRLNFELVIRSEQRLEEELKQGVREIYRQAGEITGFEGMVSFREGRDALFHLPEPTSPALQPSSGQSIIV